MRYLYLLSVFLHVAAAMIWIGGSAFLAFVMAPVLRRKGTPPEVLSAIALRFRAYGWGSLIVLILTGCANLAFRGIGWRECLDGEAFRGAAGHALAVKLILVALMLAFSAWHDFKVGPAAARALIEAPGSPEALLGRRRAGRLGRLVFLLGAGIVAAAVVFVRGGL